MTSTVDNTAQFEELQRQISGRVIGPDHADYHQARKVWNVEIEHFPAVIVKVADETDVATAIGYARASGLEISVRGGGHNFGGAAVADKGLVVDLSDLRGVRVDPETRTAKVQGGALNADLDAASQEHGLAVPAGTVSDTGIGGLTLGGGFGWLTTKHGLTIDNLIGARVVLADGSAVTANATEHPDLFWALRGGGGNFGVVTEFHYQLHPVGPIVPVGMFFWDVTDGKPLLEFARDLIGELPENIGILMAGLSGPPAPFVPQEHQFKPCYTLMVVGFGDADDHAAVVERIRAGLPALYELVTPMPYAELQKLFDGAGSQGVMAYEKSIYFEELTDEVIDVIARNMPNKRSPLSLIPIFPMGGAYCEVDDDATAFGGARKPGFVMSVQAACFTKEELAVERAWVRDFWQEMVPFASNTGGYVNFMTEYEQDRVRATYGARKYDRLAAIKAVYDPQNTFHHNGNIRPASA